MISKVNLLIICTILAVPLFAQSNIDIANQLLTRIAPKYTNQISFKSLQDNIPDRFELESIDGKIVISGNNANSMAVGLNFYLKYYCLTTVSWYSADPVEMPKVLPKVSGKISVDARCKNRFFLNYCTFGYTMPWWKWSNWERFIDWMSLNGVNMPLAITGQEAVWHKVWLKLGLTDHEIRSYFTGPAHLPWHRMSNLDYWQGNLPDSWLVNQEALQKKIVARERQFNMRPVLPAFAGHVPKELKRIYPEAKITQMSSWGGFDDKYRSSFLDPLDPLFLKIQKEFLMEQTHLFGTNNIYGADPFNEVESPNWDPEFLATVSKTIYKSITEVDPEATWLQMTWLFYNDRGKWTNPRIKAFLQAVPQDKMLLLDYYCENTEVWKQTEHYFGQPYLWCYLGNFGGNTMLAGNIKEVGKRIEDAYKNGGSNFWGLGSTLESFDMNPFMYEYVFEKAWNYKIDDEMWTVKLADRLAGKSDKKFRGAWSKLYKDIYINPAKVGQGTLTNARPSFEGHGNWTTKPEISYQNVELCNIWKDMLRSKNRIRDSYLFEIVNVGRQVLGNYFLILRNRFTQAYKRKDLVRMKEIRFQMLDLMNDLDLLLSKHATFSLNDWINDAKSFGINEQEKSYYELNARTIITTWGDKNKSLNDYANRTWSGLIASYYKPRWEMFLTDAIESVVLNKNFDEQAFNIKVTNFELDWTKLNDEYKESDLQTGEELSKKLYKKYNQQIREN